MFKVLATPQPLTVSPLGQSLTTLDASATPTSLLGVLKALEGTMVSGEVQVGSGSYRTSGTVIGGSEAPLKAFMRSIPADVKAGISDVTGQFWLEGILLRSYPGATAHVSSTTPQTIYLCNPNGTIVATLTPADPIETPPLLQSTSPSTTPPVPLEYGCVSAWVLGHPHAPDIVRLTTGKTMEDVLTLLSKATDSVRPLTSVSEPLVHMLTELQKTKTDLLLSMGTPSVIFQRNSSLEEAEISPNGLLLTQDPDQIDLKFSDIKAVYIVTFNGAHGEYKAPFCIGHDGQLLLSILSQPPRNREDMYGWARHGKATQLLTVLCDQV
ncbi:MAG: hypothetical protein AB7F28_07440 [Candidatus Margulisiibacteriota bacterium]